MSTPADAQTPPQDVGTEYDLSTPAGFEAAKMDPGLPDELVAEIMEEPAPPTTSIQAEIAVELSPMLYAALATMLLVELIKKKLGLTKLLRRFKWKAGSREVVWNLLNVVLSGVAAQTFGFRRVVLDLTGVNLSTVMSVIYGTALVAGLTEAIYKFKLTQMLRAALYKKFGVSDADVSGVRPAFAADTIDARLIDDSEE